MKNDIEKIRVAVLAYCEEVCKERMQCYGIGDGLKMSKSSSQYVIEYQDERGSWWILSTINKHTKSSESLILTFYRLLGLETRDFNWLEPQSKPSVVPDQWIAYHKDNSAYHAFWAWELEQHKKEASRA